MGREHLRKMDVNRGHEPLTYEKAVERLPRLPQGRRGPGLRPPKRATAAQAGRGRLVRRIERAGLWRGNTAEADVNRGHEPGNSKHRRPTGVPENSKPPISNKFKGPEVFPRIQDAHGLEAGEQGD